MLLTDMNDCTGCGACESVCSVKAISMQENDEGFLYPVIDNDKCISCNKCNKICPIQKQILSRNDVKAYVAWNKDEFVLRNSSSGGVFSILAEYVLKRGGVVCGAAFDENNVVRHILVEEIADLAKLRSSKYVQSVIGDIYIKIKELLKNGKEVLFSGTPCQVAGLNSFLGKDFDNLLTIDLACHGVPSPKVWQRYLQEAGEKISDFCFRDKVTGWKGYSVTYKANGKNICSKPSENIYFNGFVKNLFLRKSCSRCRFANISRSGDFTLADFWGIQKYSKKLDNYGGTSLVLANSSKAKRVLSDCSPAFAKLKEVPLEMAIRKNKVLYQALKAHGSREAFFSLLKNGSSVSEAIAAKLYKDEFHQYLNNPVDDKKVGIMNFHYSNNNFGAVMVPFSLSEVLKKHGYKPEIINFIPKFKNDKNEVFETFRERYLKRTFVCRSMRDLEIVSKNFRRFITGSDQVFRWHINGRYLFNYVSGMANIISYAGSFGKDKYEGKDIAFTKMLFKRFDAVSVREKSGVELLRDKFDVDATWVLDPTMLLDSGDYQKIIDNDEVKTPDKKYIGYMFLNNKIAEDAFEHLRKDYELVNCLKTNGKFHSVAQWLNYIKNSDYFITDSFHGSVFAILFKKQFVCLSRDRGGNSRLESLFELLGINPKRFYSDIAQINLNSFAEKIDYEKVEKHLAKAREKSLDFLLKALRMPLVYKRRLNIVYENEFTFSLFGIPIFSRKIREDKQNYYLFNCLPLVSKKPGKKSDIYKLFGLISFMSAKSDKDVRVYKLFGFLPIFKLKSGY